jgi:hypothetical protein
MVGLSLSGLGWDLYQLGYTFGGLLDEAQFADLLLQIKNTLDFSSVFFVFSKWCQVWFFLLGTG